MSPLVFFRSFNVKFDVKFLNCCELSWLAAEFQRVQNEGSIGGETKLNLQNIKPAQQPMYQFFPVLRSEGGWTLPQRVGP